jgi:hypothetical protein
MSRKDAVIQSIIIDYLFEEDNQRGDGRQHVQFGWVIAFEIHVAYGYTKASIWSNLRKMEVQGTIVARRSLLDPRKAVFSLPKRDIIRQSNLADPHGEQA